MGFVRTLRPGIHLGDGKVKRSTHMKRLPYMGFMSVIVEQSNKIWREREKRKREGKEEKRGKEKRGRRGEEKVDLNAE